MNEFIVKQPGILSLLQDGGRFGKHRIGLTSGGPLDRSAMRWANRLVHNPDFATALEVSFGGLELEAQVDTLIAATGGDLPLSINGEAQESWRSHRVRVGDRISLGFAQHFCRAYLAVSGGFQVEPSFGSASTVVREGIGGLSGSRLDAGDVLPCPGDTGSPCLKLAEPALGHYAGRYRNEVEVRVLLGYQHEHFSRLQQRRFFSAEFIVTDRADRMGYRLQGPQIGCDIEGILSEGICQGAIQVPADGQPIVLLNDRQTIGGYPKIGSALSLDTELLAQLLPGARVYFSPISPYEAHNALHLAESMMQRTEAESCP